MYAKDSSVRILVKVGVEQEHVQDYHPVTVCQEADQELE